MFALISPNEKATNADGVVGMRVVEISTNPFEVAEPLFWVSCPDDCIPRLNVYVNNELVPSEPPPPFEPLP